MHLKKDSTICHSQHPKRNRQKYHTERGDPLVRIVASCRSTQKCLLTILEHSWFLDTHRYVIANTIAIIMIMLPMWLRTLLLGGLLVGQASAKRFGSNQKQGGPKNDSTQKQKGPKKDSTQLRGGKIFKQPQGDDCPKKLNGMDVWDVVIVGGGIAGTSAAAEIAKHNTTLKVCVLILEADDRYGGRAWAAKWLHGNKALHPLCELENDVYDCNDDEDSLLVRQNWYNRSWRMKGQTDFMDLKDPTVFDNYYDTNETCISEHVLDLGTAQYHYDESVEQALLDCGWDATIDVDHAMVDWLNQQFEFGDVSRHTSLYGSYPLDVYSRDPGVDDKGWKLDYFYKGNHGMVVQNWLASIVDGVNIKSEKNHKVQTIHWQRTPIEVDVEGIGTNYARHVIATPSIGYMQDNYNTLFDPVTTQIQKKFDKSQNDLFYLIEYYEIEVQFNSLFWPTKDLIGKTPDDFSEIGACNWWLNRHIFGGTNTLVCTVTTADIPVIEAKYGEWNSTGTVKAMVNEMRSWFGEPPVGSCNRVWTFPETPIEECNYRSFDTPNQYWGGSYANWKYQQGVDVTDIDEEQENLYEETWKMMRGDAYTVQFAGEVYCDKHWSLLQGASFSGRNAARTCLWELGINYNVMGSNTEDCEVDY